MCRRLRCLTPAILLVALVYSAGSASPARAAVRIMTAQTVYLHAHAHNDYLNSSPLTGALSHGFTSVEADVWVDGDRLVLCHDMTETTCQDDTGNSEGGARSIPKREFVSTYLAPLLAQVSTNQGHVYPEYSGRFLLLIEIRCKKKDQSACAIDQPVRTWQEIEQQLQHYQSTYHGPGQLFSAYRDGHTHPGIIQPLITGGFNAQKDSSGKSVRDHISDPTGSRITSLDGVVSDVTNQTPTWITPLVSLSWSETTDNGCGGGELSPGELTAVRAAHAPGKNHYLIRIYGEPDCPHRADTTKDHDRLAEYQQWRESAWQTLHGLRDGAGNPRAVDYISSNHLYYLPQWLSAVSWVS